MDNTILSDLKNKSFAEEGTEILDSNNLTNSRAFKSFIIGDLGAIISVLTTSDRFEGDYTSFPYTSGAWYPIGGTVMTITSGSVLLIR